jgi:sugar phosphate permease
VLNSFAYPSILCIEANPHGVTVKVPELVAVPRVVVMTIFPVMAPVGTVVVTWVSDLTVKVVAATPPKVTFVVWVNPVLVIVTTVPTLPVDGEKLVIVGVTLNALELVMEPPEVVTVIFPVLQALGTVAETLLSEFTVKVVAFTPPMVTFVV